MCELRKTLEGKTATDPEFEILRSLDFRALTFTEDHAEKWHQIVCSCLETPDSDRRADPQINEFAMQVCRLFAATCAPCSYPWDLRLDARTGRGQYLGSVGKANVEQDVERNDIRTRATETMSPKLFDARDNVDGRKGPGVCRCAD